MQTDFNIAVVGLGKMGVSHLAIARETPGLTVTAVCDSSSLLGNMVEKYTGVKFHSDFGALIAEPGLDGVIIATPTRMGSPSGAPVTSINPASACSTGS